MRGKRVKALRTEERNRPGRRHGGPASGKFEYPKSWRYEKKGDFDVLVADIEDIREEVESK
jgi:hypothetical protein